MKAYPSWSALKCEAGSSTSHRCDLCHRTFPVGTIDQRFARCAFTLRQVSPLYEKRLGIVRQVLGHLRTAPTLANRKEFIEVPLDMMLEQSSLPAAARCYLLGPIGSECNSAPLQTTYATSAKKLEMQSLPRRSQTGGLRAGGVMFA